MDINSVRTLKLPILDGLEVKSATFLDKHFPLHFHQNWSLACIEKGSENISFINTEFLLNRNALVLIPPHSLHKNWGNKASPWTYQAIYLGSDVIKLVAQKLKLDYAQLSYQPYFVSYEEESFEVDEQGIFAVLENLFSLGKKTTHEPITSKKNSQAFFNDLLSHLHTNYNSIISLDSLATQFKINKFKLLRIFKSKIGLSPLAYQMAIRIENSKPLFFEDISLTEIALESGYYDQSHFTHCFKKYVGVTPGAYKQNSNILQDY